MERLRNIDVVHSYRKANMGVTKSDMVVSVSVPRKSAYPTTSSKIRLDGRRRYLVFGLEVCTSIGASSSSLSYNDEDFVDVLCSWNCVGSSHGWLGYVNPQNLSFCLFRPSLINDPSDLPYIILPPIHFVSQNPNAISKMVFSSSSAPIQRNSTYHNNNSSVLVMITLDWLDQHGDAAAFCRIGDLNWTTLTNFPAQSSSNKFQDITSYSKDKLFYVITDEGEVYSWDLSNYQYRPMKQQQNYNFRYLAKFPFKKYVHPSPIFKYYLVMDEDSGALMVIWVEFFEGSRKQKINGHQIQRLDYLRLEWFPVQALVDTALLIGRNNGIVVDVRQSPGNLMPGHIYIATNAGNVFQVTVIPSPCNFISMKYDLLRIYMTTVDGEITSFPVWNLG